MLDLCLSSLISSFEIWDGVSLVLSHVLSYVLLCIIEGMGRNRSRMVTCYILWQAKLFQPRGMIVEQPPFKNEIHQVCPFAHSNVAWPLGQGVRCTQHFKGSPAILQGKHLKVSQRGKSAPNPRYERSLLAVDPEIEAMRLALGDQMRSVVIGIHWAL